MHGNDPLIKNGSARSAGSHSVSQAPTTAAPPSSMVASTRSLSSSPGLDAEFKPRLPEDERLRSTIAGGVTLRSVLDFVERFALPVGAVAGALFCSTSAVFERAAAGNAWLGIGVATICALGAAGLVRELRDMLIGPKGGELGELVKLTGATVPNELLRLALVARDNGNTEVVKRLLSMCHQAATLSKMVEPPPAFNELAKWANWKP